MMNLRAEVFLCESLHALGFLDDLFQLADFLLHLPGYLFSDTFAFQVGVVGQLAHLLFNRALYFVNLACNLILSAWLHFVAFFEFRHGLAPWAYARTIIKKNEDGYLFTSGHTRDSFCRR